MTRTGKGPEETLGQRGTSIVLALWTSKGHELTTTSTQALLNSQTQFLYPTSRP